MLGNALRKMRNTDGHVFGRVLSLLVFKTHIVLLGSIRFCLLTLKILTFIPRYFYSPLYSQIGTGNAAIQNK